MQQCVQNVLCARLYFHLRTVDEEWSAYSTGIGTEMQVVNIGAGCNRRYAARSEVKFATVVSTARTEQTFPESETDH